MKKKYLVLLLIPLVIALAGCGKKKYVAPPSPLPELEAPSNLTITAISYKQVNLSGKKEYSLKMESVLGMLVEKYLEGKAVAQDFALERKIPFQDDRVTVILVPPLGKLAVAIDEASLISYGVEIEARSRHLIRAKIPISKLVEIAENVAGVSYIRLPLTPLPASVISEGVALTNGDDYHSAGYEGQNTKVTVIDLGFNELEMVQNIGELPSDVITKDFTETGLTTGSPHGTRVAQIVYDMAPRAQLYFIKIADEVDLENAKDYCITEGVDIINHSWGWPNTNFTDGTGLVCDIANDAQFHNILWVNAAGNATKEHYQDFFTDVDSDGWHEFAPEDETNPIQVFGGDITIFLTWDAWPTTDQDYDLYLYDSDFNLVASSTNAQTGTQPPTEKIVYAASDTGTYHIKIKKSSATRNEELKIFTLNCDLQYRTAAHSIWPPADAVGVISVAAIDQANWETGPQESYSSQGPTNDGRIKPDISGPDGVSRYAGGSVGRGYGTSYTAPHVAGAASLLLSKYPDFTVAELQSTLESWAIDMGEQGKDNIYGSGRLNLFVSVIVIPTGVVAYPNPFSLGRHTNLTFWGTGVPYAKIRIFTLGGELVKTLDERYGDSEFSWNGRNEKGNKLARGIYIYITKDSTGKIAIIK